MAKFFEELFSINFKELDFDTQKIIDILTEAFTALFDFIVTGKAA